MASTNFEIGKLGLELIRHYESLHDGDLRTIGLQPKMDPSGIWTEGWGHAIFDKNGKFVKGTANEKLAYQYSRVKTPEEAESVLITDLIPRVRSVNVIGMAKTQAEFDAHVSFVYNCGIGSYNKLLLALKSAKSDADRYAIYGKYSYSCGNQLKGLVYRRKTEATLAITGKLIFFN